jgi:hypothetical protein
MRKILTLLLVVFFSTNLFAKTLSYSEQKKIPVGMNCSKLYNQLGFIKNVSILWLDANKATGGEKNSHALLNVINDKNPKIFYLCKRFTTKNADSSSNFITLKDYTVQDKHQNPDDAFQNLFKYSNDETSKYILSKLYLPDFGLSKTELVLAFTEAQRDLSESKYITKKPSKEIQVALKTTKKQKIGKQEPAKQQKIVKKQKRVVQKGRELDKTPPTLNIKDKFVFSSANYVIEGFVSDKGSKKLFVFVDDTMVEVKRGKFKIEKFSPVDETLVVKAVDEWGNDIEKKIKIEIKIKREEIVKKVEPLKPNKIRNNNSTNTIAIVIGIEEYAQTHKATYANRDAKFFAQYATRAFGVSENNVKLLINDEATLIKTYTALAKWLPAKMEKGVTNVIVFFAGHGLASDDGKELYLLAQDSDVDLLARTALSRTELFSMINKFKPASVKAFFDTCYSGATREERTLLASARPIRVKANSKNEIPDNYTIFSASQMNQISSGFKEAKHGIFSYYLMKGMEGFADENNDRTITNGELLNYMTKNVSNKAIELGRSQKPSLAGSMDQNLLNY